MYSTVSVSSTGNYIGGICGQSGDDLSDNCFWDAEATGITSTGSGDGAGLTTAEMQSYCTYFSAGWDFDTETDNGTDDIWGINTTDNSHYPFFMEQGYSNTGAGPCCSAPTNAASSIVFGTVTGTSIKLNSYTAPTNGADGYVVYANSTNSFTAPNDGDNPTADNSWNASGQQCIYNGTSTNPNVTLTGLQSCPTNYYFKVYSYNDCSSTKTYEQTGTTSVKNTIDDIDPVPDVATLSNVTAECEVTSLTAPTATDNCAGAISASHNVTLPITTQGTTVVTWTYDDGNGNSVTQNQNVVINDVTNPVPDVTTLSDVTAECEVTSLTAPTATDNCAGTITATHNVSWPITTSTTVVWTYNDGNGNSVTQNQTVVIDDVTNPVITSTHNDDYVDAVTCIGYMPDYTSSVIATDNCDNNLTVTQSITAGTPILTPNTITLTVADDAGNEDEVLLIILLLKLLQLTII